MASVNAVEQIADELAKHSGFEDEERYKITLAVREAAVNAVLHGNAYDPAKKVTLAFDQGDKDLTIVVRDQGKGLDVDSIPDPLAPENLLKQSGRGIFLMRSLMDEVQIKASERGTEVKLIKHFHGDAADSQEASQ